MMPTCLTMQTPITSTRGRTVAQGDTGGSGRNICKNSKLKCFELKIETKNLKFNWKILGRLPLWGRSSWTSFGTVQRGWEPRMSAEYTLSSWCGSSRTRPVVKNVYLSFIIFLKRFRFVSEKRSPGSLAVEWHLGPQASLCSPHSETWRNTYFQHISSYNFWDLFSNPLEDLLLEKRDLHPRHLPPISAAHRSENRRSPRCPADKKRIIHPAWCTILQIRKKGTKVCALHNERWTGHNTVEAEASLSLAALWYP